MIIRKLHKINKSPELKCWTHQGPVLPVDHRYSVQSLSNVQLFASSCTAVWEGTLSITNYRSLLKLMSIESVMPTNHLILVIPFSSCLQSFPASGSFPMSQLSALGGQSIGPSALASVLPVNIQG